MALALAALDHHIESRREARAWSLAHAIKNRMGRKGWHWLSERLLFRDICHTSWTEGQELVAELVQAGEFYRITARGRGPDGAVSRTLFFYGWVDRRLLEGQLQKHNMPLEAFLQLERCLKHHLARVSFFRHRSDAAEHQQGDPHGDLKTRKDARYSRGRPARASHSPPRAVTNPPAWRPATPSDGRLSEHASGSPPEPLVDVPEDLRYLYPQRYPAAAAPARRRGRGLGLDRLKDLLPFADQETR